MSAKEQGVDVASVRESWEALESRKCGGQIGKLVGVAWGHRHSA